MTSYSSTKLAFAASAVLFLSSTVQGAVVPLPPFIPTPSRGLDTTPGGPGNDLTVSLYTDGFCQQGQKDYSVALQSPATAPFQQTWRSVHFSRQLNKDEWFYFASMQEALVGQPADQAVNICGDGDVDGYGFERIPSAVFNGDTKSEDEDGGRCMGFDPQIKLGITCFMMQDHAPGA